MSSIKIFKKHVSGGALELENVLLAMPQFLRTMGIISFRMELDPVLFYQNVFSIYSIRESRIFFISK